MEKPQRQKFSKIPLFWLSLCFICGIAAAERISIDPRILVAATVSFAIAAVLSASKPTAFILVLLAFFAAGAMCLASKKQSDSYNRLRNLYDQGTIVSHDPVEVEGSVLAEPEQGIDGAIFDVSVAKISQHGVQSKVRANVRVFLGLSDSSKLDEFQQLNLTAGTGLRFACRLEREDKYQNPGVISHRKLLDEQDIDAECALKSSLLLEKTSENNGFSPLRGLYERRQYFIREFHDLFDPSTAGVMIASLLGDKYYLDKQTADIFREGGTFHVLVISGLHITFIGALILVLVRRFTRNRFLQFAITGSILWLYTLAVGADVPVVRASLMFSVFLFSQAIYRESSPVNSLGICALLLLLWRPADVFTASFQLTFASVAAIVCVGVPLISLLRRIGGWMPNTADPFPPNVPVWLKRACEMLYWSENRWTIEAKRNIWTVRLFKDPFLPVLEKHNLQNAAAWIVEGILVSLTVQIFLLPFLVVYFHRISIASVLLNLWVGIFIAIESFAAVAAVLIAQISDLAAFPLVKLAEITNYLMLLLPRLLVEADAASVRLPAYAGEMRVLYGLYFLPVIFAAALIYRWRPFSIASAGKSLSAIKLSAITAAGLWAVLTLFILFHPFSAPVADGRLHVDFLDVDQGDSAFITFPDGTTLLIDGGGRQNFKAKTSETPGDEEAFVPDTARVGEAVVSAFLWNRGYSRIDHILASHADLDHIQGLEEVAANFSPRDAIFGRTPLKDADFAELFAVLRRKRIAVIKMSRGETMEIAGVKVEILNPAADENADAVSDNNHSLVLRITYGSRSFLFTGDIEADAERELGRTPEILRADVVKVAHHGSRTSSTRPFIDSAKTEFAIISVGRRSRFGHPHPEVVNRWLAANVRVLTTGDNGTISFSTDGSDLLLETFLGSNVTK